MRCGGQILRCGIDDLEPTERELVTPSYSCGSYSRCGGDLDDIQDQIDERREQDNNLDNGKIVYSNDLKRLFSESKTGFKLIVEQHGCKGDFYETYDLDEITGNYLMSTIRNRREEEPQQKDNSLTFRR